MLNRRHLRVKVLQSLYAFFQSKEDNYGKSEKELLTAVERIHDLYLYMLLTFSELKSIANHRIEENKKKIRPKEEDLNPNLKFVENRVIDILESSPELRSVSEDRKVNWIGDEHQEMFRKMLLEIREGETFFEFMNNGEDSFADDKAFVIALFKVDIANS
ncbi:MAG: antitermination protein NusB, partial [Crocinitomicaceae bacterium]|nr:antitermination protein NusB [Crocinitomicaceae bacterium]